MVVADEQPAEILARLEYPEVAPGRCQPGKNGRRELDGQSAVPGRRGPQPAPLQRDPLRCRADAACAEFSRFRPVEAIPCVAHAAPMPPGAGRGNLVPDAGQTRHLEPRHWRWRPLRGSFTGREQQCGEDYGLPTGDEPRRPRTWRHPQPSTITSTSVADSWAPGAVAVSSGGSCQQAGRHVVEGGVVGSGQQRFERCVDYRRVLPLLHRRPRTIVTPARVAAPEAHMPAQELPHPGLAVFVVPPVFEGQLDVASIDGDAGIAVDVEIPVGRFAEQPGLDEHAPGRHHRRAARPRAGLPDLVWKQHVAVADDGHLHGLHHLADGLPVGSQPVARVPGAPVHRDGVGAAVFRGSRLIEEVPIVVVPAEPDLGRHRHLRHPALHRLDDPADTVAADGRSRRPGPCA